MNKREIAELRKTMKEENTCIDMVCACYVAQDKEKTVIPAVKFAALNDGQREQYLAIFKKSIGGSIGKQLHCLPFPTEAESTDGIQDLLYRMEQDGLKDDEMIDELYDRVIDSYLTEDPYCILIMHANYDVVVKSSDGESAGSDETYSHIICSICPVSQSKSALSYNHVKHEIEDMDRMWLLQQPACAFLFPSFTDRTANIHEVLVYNKKASALNEGIIETLLMCDMPKSADEQADAFCMATQAAFDGTVTYDKAVSINDSLAERIETAASEEDLVVTVDSLKHVLEDAQAPDLDAFDKTYKSAMGDRGVFLENLVDGKFVVKMDGLTITANSDTKDLISVKDVDGVRCLVIHPNGEMDVNGIQTKIL